MPTAVATGSAGGLGAAFCAALRAKGYEVLGADLRAADRVLDVTDAAACRALAEATRPAVWINNAGVLGAGAAADQPDEEIARVVGVNLLGVINGTRAAVAVMRRAGRGHVLNVGSMASWMSPPGLAVYGATKHAVRAFTVALASELAGSGVRVALLCPDGIWTPMLHDRLDDRHSAMSFSAGRLLDPRRVAAAGVALIERGDLLASVPAVRGLLARLIGIAPTWNVRLAPSLQRRGRRAQQRLARQ